MALGFGATSGVGATDAIQTAYDGRSHLRTYFCRTWMNGAGGAGLGAVFRSGVGTSSAALLYADGGTVNLQFRVGFSTTDGVWNFPAPATGGWHSVAIRHDSSSAANAPVVFVDGVSVVVTELTAPVGAAGLTSAPFFIGNNAISGGNRNWDGRLADFAIWNAIVPQADIVAMNAGLPPSKVRPQSLVEYLPMLGHGGSVRAGATSTTGTTVVPGPALRQSPAYMAEPGAALPPAATALTIAPATAHVAPGASVVVTVAANGPLASSVTVTFTDGGAGGSFSPPTQILGPGVLTATSTYTPANPGAVTLSTSDSAALTNGTDTLLVDAANYYISATGSDANTGTSSSTPWATMAKIQAWGLVRGATYHFRGGDTFTGQIVLNDGDSGADIAKRITFQSYGVGQAILQGPSSALGPVAISDTGGWTVTNLDLRGSGVQPSTSTQNIVSLTLSGANALVLQNIAVTNCTISKGKRGLFIRGESAGSQKLSGVTVTGNEIFDCWDRAINVGMLDTVTGVDHTWVEGLEISGNHIHNINDPSATAAQTSFGIVISYCNLPQIHHNLIHDIALNSPNGGCGWFCWGNTYRARIYSNEIYNIHRTLGDGMGINLDSGSRECVVEWNYIHDCDGSGLACYAYSAAIGKPAGVAAWLSNTFRYNVVQACGKTAFGSFAVLGDGLDGCDVYGNTFVQSSTANEILWHDVAYAATNVRNFRYRNNVFLAANSGVGFVNFPAGSGSAADFVFANNAYFPSGGTGRFQWFGVSHNTVAAWGVDAAAVIADPLLSDPFNVTVFNDPDSIQTLAKVTPAGGSPLRNAGLDLKGVPYSFTPTTDYAGRLLPASGAMDIGAIDADAGLAAVTLTTEAFRNYAGTLLAGATIQNVLVHRISDRAPVLSLSNLVTNATTGVLVLTDAALVGGTAYMVTAFNADGTVRGAQRVVAA